MTVRLGTMEWQLGVDNSGFQKGLSDAENQARQFGDKTSSSFSALTVAAGTLLANGVQALAGGLKNLAGEAFNVTAEYERTTLSMEALAKRDLMNAAETEKTIVTGQRFVEGKAAELDKIAQLQIAYDGYAISLDKARYHLAEISKTQGPGDIDFRKYANDVANYEQKLADTKRKMDELGGTSGSLVDVTKNVTEQHLSGAQATLKARDAAQELLTWVHKLAVESPFDEAGAKAALQTAMTYGFMTDQAKALALEVGKITEKEAEGAVTAQEFAETAIDFAAATGQSSEVMDRIARAMGQMKQAGKVTGQDIMQLTNAGVDAMGYISKAMGVTKAEAMELRTKGLLPADAAIKAIVEGLQRDFGGAAKRQTETWSGLLSTLSETKKLGMREFFDSTFKALKPLTVGIVTTISSPKFIEGLKAAGAVLGQKVAWGVENIKGLLSLPGVIRELAALPDGFKNMAELDAILGKLPESMRGLAYAGRDLVKAFQDEGLAGAVNVIKGWAGDAWNKIKDWWDTDGEKWASDTAKKIGDWVKAIPGKLTDLAMGAGAWLANAWTSMQNWWDTSGEAWAMGIADKIGTWFGKIGDFLKSDKVPAWVNEAMFWLEDAWLGISNWWTANVAPLTESMVTGISNWMNNDLIPALQNTDKSTWTAGIGNALMDGFKGVGAWFEANEDTIAWTIGDFLGRVIVKGAELLIQAALLPVAFGEAIFKAIKSALTGKEGAGTNDIGKWLVDGLVNGIQSAFDSSEFFKKLKAAIDTFVGKVKETLGIASPSTVFASIGASLVDGLIQGMEDAKDRLIAFVIGWARSVIPKPLWAFFGIESPSKLMAEIGDNLVAGLALGIERTGFQAANAMAGVMSQISAVNASSMRFASMASGASGGSFNAGVIGLSSAPPPVTVNVYAAGGGPEFVRKAANQGVNEALRARGYR